MKDYKVKAQNLTGAATVIKDLNEPVEWLDLISQLLGMQCFLCIVSEQSGFPKLINMGNFDWYEVVGPPEPVEAKEGEEPMIKRSLPLPGGENSLVIYYGGGNELELSPEESRIFIATLADAFKQKTGNAYKMIKPGSRLITLK